MKEKKSTLVIGLMSGTSLDGLDIALCRFTNTSKGIDYNILSAQTVEYSKEWTDKLSQADKLNSLELSILSKEYGKHLAFETKKFIDQNNCAADLISSHGHTVFHQPEKGITLQIGNGPELFKSLGIQTICDFRVQDVELGGQGAPLVPIGDEILFSEYDYCVNLGGFANISLRENDQRIAYDICPLNIVMNAVAKKEGHDYDKDGFLASQGEIIPSLLTELNGLSYYQKPPPKSLGKEWVIKNIDPLLLNHGHHDILRTFVEHSAQQIANQLKHGTALFTGGGVYNTFLMEEIQKKTKSQCIIPSRKLVEFKEALIFALLGYLKLNNKINCLKSVTGAKTDHSSGKIYQ